MSQSWLTVNNNEQTIKRNSNTIELLVLMGTFQGFITDTDWSSRFTTPKFTNNLRNGYDHTGIIRILNTINFTQNI